MLKNHFIIALRSLLKYKVISFIHILGLTIGTAACLLIFQYIHFERSYDRFLDRATDIYRVPIRYSEGFGVYPRTAANHPGLGPAMKADFPEVENYTRILHPSNVGANLSLSRKNEAGQQFSASEEKLYYSDSSFFEIFSFPLIAGSPATALSKPNTIAISASTAKKYFGQEDPMGKELHLNRNRPLTVTAVFEDIPANSHLELDGLLSSNTFFDNINPNNLWIWPEFHTYVRLAPETDASALEAKFPAFTDRYMAEIHQKLNFHTYFSLQPVVDIHLKTECANEITTPGSERMVYFLTLLGVFILVIAWVNYINLSTSRSLERAKEVGVRKVIGARKNQLISQFLSEATLLNALGIFIGVVLAKALLPAFTDLVGKEIGDSLLNVSLMAKPIFWLILIGGIIFGGFIAGFYPALVISAFQPVDAIKDNLHPSSRTVFLRKLLVGFQFVLSILLISATILVMRQLSYMSNKELGYAKDQILVVRAPMVSDSTTFARAGILANKLESLPQIASMAKSSEIPGKVIPFRNDIKRLDRQSDVTQNTNLIRIDDRFLSTFGMKLAAGRNFEKSDSSVFFKSENNKIMVNETVVSNLGYETPNEIISKKLRFKVGQNNYTGEVIGVFKDYHQRSVKEAYDPILYYYPTFNVWNYFSIKMGSENVKELLAEIETTYKGLFPDSPFNYFFLDEFFDRQYRADQQFSKVCLWITGFAIFVACLGFFALSTLILIRRAKEIGIRKILGAQPASILLLITKDFISMLLIANIVSIPIIIYFGQQWLNNFAFSVNLSWEIFVLPLAFLLLIVFTLVGIQVYRTSVLNPIQAIRSE